MAGVTGVRAELMPLVWQSLKSECGGEPTVRATHSCVWRVTTHPGRAIEVDGGLRYFHSLTYSPQSWQRRRGHRLRRQREPPTCHRRCQRRGVGILTFVSLTAQAVCGQMHKMLVSMNRSHQRAVCLINEQSSLGGRATSRERRLSPLTYAHTEADALHPQPRSLRSLAALVRSLV